ncbi:MAG: Mur ligase domain-containing protein, partial [Candidatus Omnitrophica bacterium]|nr:Mur ligase domain-containing protein [Candidatus Omnitrophota bacterium]
MKNILAKKRKLHFIGIGGIGMSSIASILLSRGFKISGSDIKPNRLTQKLKETGACIFIGHRAENLPGDADAVVYSTSIDEKNPEIIKAKKLRLPIMHRSDIVAELVNRVKGVAVTGAHGKTTTTAMSALLLTEAGLDPTAIVGGEVGYFDANWRDGKGGFAVCEADESDGTFLKLKPRCAILTNIDEEHLDYYGNLKNIIDANS